MSPGQMGPEVKTHSFARRVVAHHLRHRGRHIVGIDSDLSEEHRRAREMQALGSWIRGMKSRSQTYTMPYSITEVHPQAVKDIARVVEDLAPEWIYRVLEVCRFTNNADDIVEETGYDYDTVAAIVSRLVEVGELPPVEPESAIDDV